MNRGVAAALGLTPFGIGNTIYAANKANDLGVGMQHGLGVTTGQGSGGLAGLLLGMSAKRRPALKGALGALLGAPIGGMGWGAGMASGFNDIRRRKAGITEKSAFWKREPERPEFNTPTMSAFGALSGLLNATPLTSGIASGVYAGARDDSLRSGLLHGAGATAGSSLGGLLAVLATRRRMDPDIAVRLGRILGGAGTGALMAENRNQNLDIL